MRLWTIESVQSKNKTVHKDKKKQSKVSSMEIFTNKWAATVASIWIQCSGTTYTFSLYSSAIKATQGYNQSTLDTVAAFLDIGGDIGVLSGLLYSAVASKHSPPSGTQLGRPWIVHLAGAVQSFVGYFFTWAAVAGVIPRPPVPAMCLFIFLAAHAQTFFNTANVVCGIQNFPYHGGTIVGIMKGFNGLSGAILVQAFDVVCEGNPTTYLLMLALLTSFVSLSLMHFVRIYETSTKSYDKNNLNAFSAIALIIVAYRMISIILENFFIFPSWAQTSSFILVLLLLVSPLGIAIKAQRDDSQRVDSSGTEDHLGYEEVPSSDDKPLKQTVGDRDMNLLQAIGTLDFWLLFIAMVCGMGTGAATINNMSQLGQSLGYKTKEINSLVALLSIWNFLGRLGAGYVSDLLLHERRVGRPLLMAITLAIMGFGHIIIASGFSGNLYFGSFLVGICFGSQWSLLPIITSEIFGIGHVATIFNTITTASPVGSYIFSVKVIGYIYDKEAFGEEDNSCFGTHCFMLSFLIMAFVAFFGCLVALIVFFRTKRFYQLVVLGRLEHSIR